MPCKDPLGEIQHRSLIAEKLDFVTRAACDMRTILRRHGLEKELCEETKAWIQEHDMVDAIRLQSEREQAAREKIKEDALKKLNLDERRVLGL